MEVSSRDELRLVLAAPVAKHRRLGGVTTIEVMLLDPVFEVAGRTDENVLAPEPPEDAQVGRLQFPYSVADVRERLELPLVGQRLARAKLQFQEGQQLLLRCHFDFPCRLDRGELR